MLAREDFAGLVRSSVAGMGFDRDIAMVIFPVDRFLVESDISPIQRALGEFIAGLTSWVPAARQKGLSVPPRLRIEAGNHEEATARFNQLFLNTLWGDGLPLAPPTEARVAWISRGTDMAPEAEVGRVMPRGGIATVETLAVALAMAGGRPEYLAVLIAAMAAILDAAMHHDKWQTTSASTFPTVIVNGPVARDTRLNAGFGLLGPDPRRPAGAPIGRAIRRVQQNVGGALWGGSGRDHRTADLRQYLARDPECFLAFHAGVKTPVIEEPDENHVVSGQVPVVAPVVEYRGRDLIGVVGQTKGLGQFLDDAVEQLSSRCGLVGRDNDDGPDDLGSPIGGVAAEANAFVHESLHLGRVGEIILEHP